MNASRSPISAIVIAITLILTGIAITDPLDLGGLPAGSADAAPPPPDDNVNGTQYVDGDWTVSSLQSYTDETLILSGNLTITTSGKLIFENVTLVMNCTTDGQYAIVVEGSILGGGGKLYSRNGTFMSADPDMHYNFTVEANALMRLRWCTVRDLNSPGLADITQLITGSAGGIEVRSDNVEIRDCDISSYAMFGISVLGADPDIIDCSITGDIIGTNILTAGIFIRFETLSGASPSITGCNITFNGAGAGIAILGSPLGFPTVDPLIDGCGISLNGIGVQSFFGTPEIGTLSGGNTIAANGIGVNLWGSDGDVRGNNITQNVLYGIAASDINIIAQATSDGDIDGNDIHHNLVMGIFVNGSSGPHITDNNIYNNIAGINITRAAPVIDNNNILNNSLVGIFAESASPEITNNNFHVNTTAYYGRNPAGVSLYNCTTGSCTDNTFELGWAVDGIHLEEIGSSVDLSGNLFYEGLNTYGFYVDGGSPVIEDNHFKIDGAMLESIGVIAFSSQLTLLKNDFECSKDGGGISIHNSDGVAIEQNTLLGEIDSHGLILYNTSGTISDNVLEGGQGGTGPHHLWETGIKIVNSGDITLNGNTVDTFSTNCQILDSTDVELIDNSFTLAQEMNMNISRCTDLVLDGNVLDDSDSLIDNCTILSPGTHSEGVLTFLNTTVDSTGVDESKYMLLEEGAKLEVYWYLDVTVKDHQDNLVEGANVLVRPLTYWWGGYQGNEQWPGTWINRTTPDSGSLLWNRVREVYVHNAGPGAQEGIQALTTLNSSATASLTGLHSATEVFSTDMSRHITLTLGPNAAPPAPTKITPAETHNTTPLIAWDPAIDPDGDAVKYCVNIRDGPAGAGSPLVDDVMVTNHSYQVAAPLEYGHTYTVEVISKDSYGMYSDMAQGQVDVVNTAPAITTIGGEAVPDDGSAIIIAGAVDTPVSIAVEAVDDDTDPIDILTFTDDTYFFDIDPANGTIEWTPSSPQWGKYTVNITVSDGIGGADTVTVLFTITTPNLPPIANAGEDYVTTLGGTATLNGTGSYDPDGDISKWEWKCVSHALAMEDADGPNPTFEVAYEGVYVFTLRVQDDNRTWCEAPDTVTVTANSKGYVNEEPELIDGTVTPEQGDVSEDFTFYVNYVDADGDLPDGDGHIRVVVDDVAYNLTALEPVVNVSIRTVYGVTISGEVLGVGSDHTYRFEAHDGLDPATGDTAPHFGPVVIEDPFVGPNGTPPDGGDGDTDGDDGSDGGGGGSSAGSGDDNTLLIAAIILVIVAIVVVLFLVMYLRRKGKGEGGEANIADQPATAGAVRFGKPGAPGGPPPPGGAPVPRPAPALGTGAAAGAGAAPLPLLPPGPKGEEGAKVKAPKPKGGDEKDREKAKSEEKPVVPKKGPVREVGRDQGGEKEEAQKGGEQKAGGEKESKDDTGFDVLFVD